MSDVSLSIGGRTYTVACADGEEAHLVHLGTMIDDRLSKLGGRSAHSETRGLLYAALFLADELVEAQKGAVAPGETPQPPVDLEKLAEALELCATRLEEQRQAS
jgi:cell division protein ZapA